jgi:hypothetical protein
MPWAQICRGVAEHEAGQAAEYRTDDRRDGELVAPADAVGGVAADEAERRGAEEKYAEHPAKFR